MSARRLTAVERAQHEERERCIDQLLSLAARSLDLAAATAYPVFVADHLDDARAYYRSAWMLAAFTSHRSIEWPTPGEWIGYAREALGIGAAEHREAA